VSCPSDGKIQFDLRSIDGNYYGFPFSILFLAIPNVFENILLPIFGSLKERNY